jgi:hypothetical protein
MKIKLREMLTGPERDSWLSHLVMHIMTEHTKNAEDWCKTFGLKPIVEGQPEQHVDLKITINGVECKFEYFVKLLEQQHDDMLERRTNEKLRNLGLGELHQIVADLEKNIEKKIEEVFPGFRRSEW